MANVFTDLTSRTAIAARIAEERPEVESWNELAAPDDYDLSFDKVEYQIRPAKWPSARLHHLIESRSAPGMYRLPRRCALRGVFIAERKSCDDDHSPNPTGD